VAQIFQPEESFKKFRRALILLALAPLLDVAAHSKNNHARCIVLRICPLEKERYISTQISCNQNPFEDMNIFCQKRQRFRKKQTKARLARPVAEALARPAAIEKSTTSAAAAGNPSARPVAIEKAADSIAQ
jgi:hypothetical protein